MRVAAVNACVSLIAETCGSIPLHAYQRTSDGGKRRVDDANSLGRVLRKPNSWQTPMEFRSQLTAHMLLRGNAYAWINWAVEVGRDAKPRDVAQELIPMHPDRVSVETGWNQRVPRVQYFFHSDRGDKVLIPSDEILHLRGLSSDGVMARSVLSDAADAIGCALSTQRYAAALFENDATPGIAISHPKRLAPEVAKKLKENWDDLYKGPRNARGTAVLEEGMTISRISMTAEDAQFLETRQFQRSEIAGLFRVPPHLIGDVDRSTSWGTGIEQQQIAFLVYTIRPWLVRWEQAIHRAIVIREGDYFVEHLVDGLMRGDIKSRYAAYATGRQWGWLSANDIRGFENQNPIEGGDVYVTPLNMAPVGTLSATGGDERQAAA